MNRRANYLLIGAVLAVTAVAEPTRIEKLRELGIEITAVEFEYTHPIQCEGVPYWHPLDPNQDGRIEGCLNLAYDPCVANDGEGVLIRHVLAGGSCEAPEPIQCDGFSPLPPECP